MIGLSSIEYLMGLNGLAMQFHQDWLCGDDGEREIVRRFVSGDLPLARAVMLRDVALSARLSEGDFATLWLACVDESFGFAADFTVPDFLAMIREACDRVLPPPPPFAGPVAPIEAVVAEIAAMGPAFARSGRLADKAAALTAALTRCARDVSAELALRFLLRITVHNCLPVRPGQFEALRRLGQQLDYDELLVDDLDLLVTTGPED